jgi:GntR family transcriptional regulator, transcriptional repressor for pyruvate dehydrogenase complex
MLDEVFSVLPRESSLSIRMAQQVEELLMSGRLGAGSRLPTERELARQFGVSRTVVREAVAGLIARGLLETAPGGGLIARTPGADTVARSMQLFLRAGFPDLNYAKVHEIRRVLEVEIAALAASRRTPADLNRLETNLDQMADAGDALGRAARLDVEFHDLLANSSDNVLFPVLLESMVGVMLVVREMGLQVPGAFPRALQYHRRILEQVRAGDPAGARQAMLDHLSDSELTMAAASLAARSPAKDAMEPAGDRSLSDDSSRDDSSRDDSSRDDS